MVTTVCGDFNARAGTEAFRSTQDDVVDVRGIDMCRLMRGAGFELVRTADLYGRCTPVTRWDTRASSSMLDYVWSVPPAVCGEVERPAQSSTCIVHDRVSAVSDHALLEAVFEVDSSSI